MSTTTPRIINIHIIIRRAILSFAGGETQELITLFGQDAKEENQEVLVRTSTDHLVFHLHYEDTLAELREVVRLSSQESEGEEVNSIIFV